MMRPLFFNRGNHSFLRGPALATAALGVVLGGCGTPQGQDGQGPGHLEESLSSDNGLSINGLSINGLSINGLSINGLSINGLKAGSFSTWFNQNPAYAPSVMNYVVKCALLAGKQLSWQNPSTGTSYTWVGVLGLAPGWSGGQPATLPEQQVVSACLAAHANKFGVHVPLAVEGRDATGAQLAISPGELTTYSLTEGCFFGNLFIGDGAFAGAATSLDTHQSSARACAMTYSGTQPDCSPILHVGTCATYCQMDPTNTFYTTCSYGGKNYLPLATRLQPQSINECGDGLCQIGESCGNGNGPGRCQKDCGKCP